MLTAPARQEIDHRTIKLIVGLVALTLPGLTGLLTGFTIDSISESYFAGGRAQIIFIGFLFAIAAFLLAYNGTTSWQMVLAKVAAVAAAAVALFPCSCNGHQGEPAIHYIAAAVMFAILAFFSGGFYRRARAKNHARAKFRARIYALCTWAIVLAIVALGYDGLFGHRISDVFPKFTYVGEAVGLVAFGISWLLASRVLPGLTAENERFSPFRAHNPD